MVSNYYDVLPIAMITIGYAGDFMKMQSTCTGHSVIVTVAILTKLYASCGVSV